MTKHSTKPVIAEKQAVLKLKEACKYITPEEKREDALVEVLSFLVSVRDHHHRHKLSIHDAIAKISSHQKKPVVEVRKFLVVRRDGEQCWINVWDAIELIKGVLDS